MELTLPELTGLSALVFLIAFLYASVGHGGASGYLAVLSFMLLSPAEMATTALILNILVAGTALVIYSRAGHFSWRLTGPLILASAPAAFLGGLIPVREQIYYLVLALVLLFAAYRLAVDLPSPQDKPKLLTLKEALPVGGGIGFLSGLIGIGGGIFLSPLLLLGRWADAKSTSATAACFIVVNALAGLGGRLVRYDLYVGTLTPLLLAGFLGGLIGAWLGAHRFSGLRLRRVLALVLVIAAVKLFIHAF